MHVCKTCFRIIRVWLLVCLKDSDVGQKEQSAKQQPPLTFHSPAVLYWYFLLFYLVASQIVFVPACSLSGGISAVCKWWWGRLGRGGVTKLGSGPSGFQSLLSGDTCVVTGRLHGAALWSIWGWLVVAVRVNRSALCGYASAKLPEVDAAH